jgi:patatin-like phospholipase/acyl hydrolase
MSEQIRERLTAPGPKRILALDGGGIRGAISLGFLKKIETNLRSEHLNPDLKLCDYFDLIGGTSTGSIIATLLALGYDVDTIRKLYLQLGEAIFGQKNNIWNPLDWADYLSADFDAGPLEKQLKSILGDMTLGTEDLKTGLVVVAKRADTFSTWPMFNNPDAQYYESVEEGQYGNKDYLLREVVRASTAAPSYFRPQVMDIGGQEAAFIDGGVSMANNPALQLFMMATCEGYRLNWETGTDKLLLVSIGTGTHTKSRATDELKNFNKLDWAKNIADLFMEDASWQNQMILQLLGESPTAQIIDGEIGNLANDRLGGKKWLTYIRYNAWLQYPHGQNAKPAYQNIKRMFSEEELIEMHEMSNAALAPEMMQVGDFYADIDVDPEHIPADFIKRSLVRGA